jgi:hypothetical protein
MTTEGAAPTGAVEAPGAADDGRLFCYRHPDRETYVRCGRCDRPICPRCAMQGPVGFRCRSCGKPAIDPLRTIKPGQAVAGFAIAVGAGTVGAVLGLQTGFFGILVGFFAGGITADLVMRVTGFKTGVVMAAILLGGIALGTAIAFGLSYGITLAQIAQLADGEEVAYPFLLYLADAGLWALVYAGAAMFGAWGRLRL